MRSIADGSCSEREGDAKQQRQQAASTSARTRRRRAQRESGGEFELPTVSGSKISKSEQRQSRSGERRRSDCSLFSACLHVCVF